MKRCCICNKVIKGYGHNAEPVKDGICCDKCNADQVLPARIILAIFDEAANKPPAERAEFIKQLRRMGVQADED